MQQSVSSTTTVLVAATVTLLYAASQRWNNNGSPKSLSNKAKKTDGASDGGADEDQEQMNGAQEKINTPMKDMGNDQKVDQGVAFKVAPFPWEIASDSKKTSLPSWSNEPDPSNSTLGLLDPPMMRPTHTATTTTATTNRHPTTSESQIEFLASMTFANGGLRSPNCPCCI